jgi:hypothetical protein
MAIANREARPTLHATDIMTALTINNRRPQILSKPFWMRANRVLAWTLLFSPLVQLAMHMTFARGLQLDLALLLGHGALSLILFGKPKARTRTFRVEMHVLGFRLHDLSERNRFLLGGYRIALGAFAATVMFMSGGLTAFVTFIAFFYPLLRQPVTVIQHIYNATMLALRRWGMGENADVIASSIVLAFMLASFVNLVK